MQKKDLGFTLIEVMIVVVIVAILAAIAFPSYQDQMFRTRRTDATEALMSIAALQERFYLQNNEYADASDDVWSAETAEGYYTISLDTTFTCPGAAEDEDRLRCFRMEAVPAAGSPQRGDDDCQSLTIDNVGRKSATNADGDESDECW